jgi:hypothetical protein
MDVNIVINNLLHQTNLKLVSHEIHVKKSLEYMPYYIMIIIVFESSQN